MRKALLGVHAMLAACTMAGSLACAAPRTQVQVRVVTGAQDLAAGSVLELRIYDAGRPVVHAPLTHGESWPHGSTHVIPVTLSEPIDPRTVLRFALYYRAASALSAPFEVVAADVDVSDGRTPELLLGATLAGVVSRQGELASEERAQGSVTCVTDADCDDHRRCNGHERCAPGTAAADARGCVKGTPVVCPVNQVCTEAHGCRGLEPAHGPPAAPQATAPDAPPAAGSSTPEPSTP